VGIVSLYGLLVSYRIVDITVWHGASVIVDSILYRFDFTSIRRTLVLLVANIWEYGLCFAWLYLHSGGVRSGGKVLSEASTALYFSLTTLMTVGYGDWTPQSGQARAIFLFQAGIVLVVLLIVLPLYLALVVRDLGVPPGSEVRGGPRSS
jgi:hypothetical protein